jgi:betaine reductase
MNGRDHLKKGLPLLEDVLGAFAVLVTADDGLNPVIRTYIVGRHRIGTGATPQAVMEALVVEPLQRAGLKLAGVDRYAPELQNPELTEPAGAGNVPWANYKMIGALAVLRKEIERTELEEFACQHGLPGYAPTQGHVPSGVPFLGFAREGLLNGKYQRVMIIGKGSLFLARLTKLFDGISLIIEPNKREPGQEEQDRREVRTLVAEALRRVARELEEQAR